MKNNKKTLLFLKQKNKNNKAVCFCGGGRTGRTEVGTTAWPNSDATLKAAGFDSAPTHWGCAQVPPIDKIVTYGRPGGFTPARHLIEKCLDDP